MSVYSGKKLSLSVFGQSHSEAIGVVLEGVPAGLPVDMDALNAFMARRAPSSAAFSTKRKEPDEPVFVGGVLNGVTTGAAVCALIYNKDARSRDYNALRNTPRPGHADYTARVKYGGAEDIRGGGAFSGRMTAPLCIAGALALQWLGEKGVTIGSHIQSVAGIQDESFDPVTVTVAELTALTRKPFGTISEEKGAQMLEAIAAAREEQDSLGGVIECAAVGVPAGCGGELFDGLESALARLVFSVPAVKGFEIGAGFRVSEIPGSENNDAYYYDEEGRVKTVTNNHGGILGGITSGMPVIFRAAIKPTPSIGKIQQTVDLSTGQTTHIQIGGRHDSCVVPRALPVLECCMALALLDEMI